MRPLLCLALSLWLTVPAFSQENGSVIHGRLDSTLRIRINGYLCWYAVDKREYLNQKQDGIFPEKQVYRKRRTASFHEYYDDKEIVFHLKAAGTFYLAWGKDSTCLPDSICSPLPPSVNRQDCFHCVQVVVRESDDYAGYLTELLHTPFILPPMRIRGLHQTDVRAGADCAELAIYGKRREGYDIPYCGPKGISRYLDSLKGPVMRGAVLHFGGQVSVLYEDRGVEGLLDNDDLLIEAYGSETKIVRLADCAYAGRPLTLYRWKKELPRRAQ